MVEIIHCANLERSKYIGVIIIPAIFSIHSETAETDDVQSECLDAITAINR